MIFAFIYVSLRRNIPWRRRSTEVIMKNGGRYSFNAPPNCNGKDHPFQKELYIATALLNSWYIYHWQLKIHILTLWYTIPQKEVTIKAQFLNHPVDILQLIEPAFPESTTKLHKTSRLHFCHNQTSSLLVKWNSLIAE